MKKQHRHRWQQRQRQQEERQDNPSDGQDFIQKLRLGLFGTEETI